MSTPATALSLQTSQKQTLEMLARAGTTPQQLAGVRLSFGQRILTPEMPGRGMP